MKSHRSQRKNHEKSQVTEEIIKIHRSQRKNHEVTGHRGKMVKSHSPSGPPYYTVSIAYEYLKHKMLYTTMYNLLWFDANHSLCKADNVE